MLNRLSQIVSVTRFGLLSIPQRRGSAAAAIFGVAGVVCVLVGVLSMATGFRKVMANSGAPDAAIVLRGAADSEMVSGFLHDSTRIISDAPGIARSADGPLASSELFVVINLLKRSTGTDANVPLRGVGPAAFQVRDKLKVEKGRLFDWGKNEIIVGVGAAREFSGLEVGSAINVAHNDWSIVGIFSANGGMAESEIWTDATVLQGAYNRGDTYQSVYAKLVAPDAFFMFSNALAIDPRLNVKVLRQSEYYAEQSSVMTKLIKTLGYVVASLMAIGAVFGALNTMYTAVSSRTREIATLRALGFGSGSVVVSIMLESMVLALVGGSIGAAVAHLVFHNFHTATMNFQSFSQVTFAFDVTPQLLAQGIIWATVIGLIGGLFPALRAAHLPIAAALREL
jgi:putative ABC transport system permease protein